jgi:hypothetical protein
VLGGSLPLRFANMAAEHAARQPKPCSMWIVLRKNGCAEATRMRGPAIVGNFVRKCKMAERPSRREHH